MDCSTNETGNLQNWKTYSPSSMEQQTSAIFKSDQTWINLFVGGEVYPVMLKTLLNPSTCGNWFKDRVNKSTDYIIKVACVQWDSSPNHIKYRMDIDRDGKVFRMVLQFLRNGKKTALPDDKFTLHELMREAEFFGMDALKYLIKKKLWKITGKASYFACYSDSE